MELIVSDIVLVVSVVLVIDPCVKLGTTGTAWAVAAVNRIATALVAILQQVHPEVVIVNVLNQRSVQ